MKKRVAVLVIMIMLLVFSGCTNKRYLGKWYVTCVNEKQYEFTFEKNKFFSKDMETGNVRESELEYLESGKDGEGDFDKIRIKNRHDDSVYVILYKDKKHIEFHTEQLFDRYKKYRTPLYFMDRKDYPTFKRKDSGFVID